MKTFLILSFLALPGCVTPVSVKFTPPSIEVQAPAQPSAALEAPAPQPLPENTELTIVDLRPGPNT